MILVGDCLETLKTLDEQSVHCCVTSPPYFGLRDYGVDGQLGLESSPEEYIAGMVEVFREVKRVLRDDGTLWLNIGDSYAPTNRGVNARPKSETLTGLSAKNAKSDLPTNPEQIAGIKAAGIKTKDLIGIPWMLAFALRADGWYLRQDIIWHKPNPMPESVRDRCTKSHEYIFLLSKSAKYHYDHEAIKEPLAASSVARLSQPTLESQAGSDRVPGKTNGRMKAVGPRLGGHKYGDDGLKQSRTKSGNEWTGAGGTRNKRSVWIVTTKPYKGAHFATFPPDLIEPCILAGCPPNGTVLDPFFGAGTTGFVSDQLGRKWIGCELNPEYAKDAEKRIATEKPRLALARAEPFA